MRSDEEFREEVFKRCEQKLKKEKRTRKRAAVFLCAFVIVCCAAGAAVSGGFNLSFFNKGILESNGIEENGIYNGEENSETKEESTCEYNSESPESCTEISPESGNNEGVQQESAKPDDFEIYANVLIRENEEKSFDLIDSEQAKNFYSIIENALNSGGNAGGDEIKNQWEAEYTVTFFICSMDGEYSEKYYISGGYIKKEGGEHWKKLSESGFKEIQDFIAENAV